MAGLAPVVYAAGASVTKTIILISVGAVFGRLGWIGRRERSAFALVTAYALQPAFFLVGVTNALIGKGSDELLASTIFPLGAFWHVFVGGVLAAGAVRIEGLSALVALEAPLKTCIASCSGLTGDC